MKDDLRDIIHKNPDKYGHFYIENIEAILSYSKEREGIKSDTFLTDLNKDLDRIRFSAVFSDFTNIYPVGLGGGGNVVIKTEQKVTVNDEVLKAVIQVNEKPILHAGFAIRNEKEFTPFLKNIEPLIDSEMAMVHNSRLVIGLTDKKGPDGSGRVWRTWEVQPDSPVGNWLTVENSKSQDSIPIDFKPNVIDKKNELFEITVPYLNGIEFSDLTLILRDNYDLISSFRINLKELIKNAEKDGKTISEMKNDLVRPQVDQLNAKFKSISYIHKLKVGGTVFSTVSLGLLSYSTMSLGTIISSFLGSSGLGLLVKHEVDYQKEISKLQENPFYLMWKFKKASNGA